jgi:hypothetical protein
VQSAKYPSRHTSGKRAPQAVFWEYLAWAVVVCVVLPSVLVKKKKGGLLMKNRKPAIATFFLKGRWETALERGFLHPLGVAALVFMFFFANFAPIEKNGPKADLALGFGTALLR